MEVAEKADMMDGIDSLGSIALRADALHFTVAQSTDELAQAYRLVYKNYLRAEYIDPHSSEMRYSAHNALPSTVTFVAKLDDAVVTTASIVFDSPLGLPMDMIYKDELDVLRQQHARLCEVTMLADRRRAGMRTIPSILQVFKLVLHYTLRYERTTDIVITINPSHEAFYTKYLPFSDLAGLKYYPSVKNAPALAKRAHLADLKERSKWQRLYEFFMNANVPDLLLATKKKWTEEEMREFFVVKRDILGKLPPAALEHVKGRYPGYDFARIMAPVEK